MGPSSRDRALGALVVAAGVAFQSAWLGRAAALLSVALVLSYVVWLQAWSVAGRRLHLTYWVGLAVFLCHASEEFLTGFQRELPALVGARWTDARFLIFIGVWLTAFVIAGLGLRQRHPLAVLIVLFFALAGGVLNGIGHLGLAVLRGGYFPGAWTAPLCLVVGVSLLRQLFTSEDTHP